MSGPQPQKGDKPLKHDCASQKIGKIQQGNSLISDQYGASLKTLLRGWNPLHHRQYPRSCQHHQHYWYRTPADPNNGPILRRRLHNIFLSYRPRSINDITVLRKVCTKQRLVLASLRTDLFKENEELYFSARRQTYTTSTHCVQSNTQQSNRRRTRQMCIYSMSKQLYL